MSNIRYCPISGGSCRDGNYDNVPVCAWWVSSSSRCSIKDIAHTIKQSAKLSSAQLDEILSIVNRRESND